MRGWGGAVYGYTGGNGISCRTYEWEMTSRVTFFLEKK